MCVLPGPTRSSVAAVLACLIVFAQGKASADESTGRSPFGALRREGFAGFARPAGTAEHEALFWRPEDPTPDAWGAAAPVATPPDDVVFAAPVLPTVQEIVTGSIKNRGPLPGPQDATTSPWGVAAQPGDAAADAVSAAPPFPAVDGAVKFSTHTTLPPWRPEDASTDAWSEAAQSSTPADAVVFAAPVLTPGQQLVTGWTNAPVPPPHPDVVMKESWSGTAQSSRPADAVVFAAPVLAPGQQLVAGWTNAPVPPPRPDVATTESLSGTAQSSGSADAVVFAAPILTPGQALVTGWTKAPVPTTRPEEARIEAASVVAQTNRSADAAVSTAPALPAGQEPVAGPSTMLLPPPLLAATVDAVVFGPPSRGADSASISDRLAGPLSAPAPPTGTSPDRALAPEEAARLKARARGLLANGSLASARALLQNAASRGDAEGAYLLAQTYDPEALTRSGMIGVAGDAAKAEALYHAAQLGGYGRSDKNARAAQP